MVIKTNISSVEKELYELTRQFENTEEDILEVNGSLNDFYNIEMSLQIGDKTHFTSDKIKRNIKVDEIKDKRYYKRFIKNCLYNFLSNIYDTKLPWGSLTGVRPTRVAYDLINDGNSIMNMQKILESDFKIFPEKAKLVCDVVKNQKGIMKNDKLVDFYVNIPFCPSRCSYCSFISSEISCLALMVPQYIDCLIKEIRETKNFMFDNAYIVNTVYIGGGTPTSLEDYQLEMILSELKFDVNEFTVECGRPDTITKSKLDLLKKYGVTRISINPQTFSNRTLKKINRNHTVKDFFNAYNLALNYEFDINMDLIAGLEGEKFARFKKNVDIAVDLCPTNITIHTLALKRGSTMSLSFDKIKSKDIEKMLSYAHKKLKNYNYQPYYMYRQKNMAGCLENVGYAIDGKVCKFNIDSMEEFCSIFAVGANAISKKVSIENGRIDRFANVKNIPDYVNRIDEMIAKKFHLFK